MPVSEKQEAGKVSFWERAFQQNLAKKYRFKLLPSLDPNAPWVEGASTVQPACLVIIPRRRPTPHRRAPAPGHRVVYPGPEIVAQTATCCPARPGTLCPDHPACPNQSPICLGCRLSHAQELGSRGTRGLEALCSGWVATTPFPRNPRTVGPELLQDSRRWQATTTKSATAPLNVCIYSHAVRQLSVSICIPLSLK